MATQQQIDQFLNGMLIRDQNNNQIVQNQQSKQDKKIASAQAKMDNELTGDKDIDTVVTTPQSQWTAYQIAVANLNPELKQRNRRYQSALNNFNILQNEKVNLGQAGQLMLDAYKESMQRTEDAAQNQMMANSMNANIQAGGAISGMGGLAVNPAAAAQTRIAAQNQAAAQNATVRSNADQNIANIYNNAAQMPATIANISSTNAGIDAQQAQIDTNNRQLDIQASQAEANNNLANAQAEYYRRQGSSNGGSNTVKQTTNDTDTNTDTDQDTNDETWGSISDGSSDYEYTIKDGKVDKVRIKGGNEITATNTKAAIVSKINQLISNK